MQGREPSAGDVAGPDSSKTVERGDGKARASALGALLGLVGTSVALALGSASSPAVPDSIQALDAALGPLPDIGFSLSGSGFSALLVAMVCFYSATLALVAHLGLRSVGFAVVGLHALFLLGPLLLNTDLFLYLAFARNGVLHELNPYVDAMGAAGDPAVAYASRAWVDRPTLYGPLFTVFSYGAAPLGLVGGLWAIKLSIAAASLGSVALVRACAQRLARSEVAAVALVGLNPLLLVVVVGGAHNDAILAAIFALTVFLLTTARPRWSGAVAATAGAIKATGAVVIPFLLVGARWRLDVLAGMLAMAAGITLMTAVVFGPRALLEMLGSLVGYRGGHRLSRQSVPGQAVLLLGASAIEFEAWIAGLAIFVLALAFLLARTWQGTDWVASAGWAVLAMLLLMGWVRPWYVAWLLPLAALARSRFLRPATVALTALIVVAVPQSGSLGGSFLELLLRGLP